MNGSLLHAIRPNSAVVLGGYSAVYGSECWSGRKEVDVYCQDKKGDCRSGKKGSEEPADIYQALTRRLDISWVHIELTMSSERFLLRAVMFRGPGKQLMTIPHKSQKHVTGTPDLRVGTS